MANIIDKVAGALSPGWGAKRERARAKLAAYKRATMQYDGATTGRRAYGWRAVSTDANDVALGARGRLRDVVRDMVRNNSTAASAVTKLGTNVVGRGIIPTLPSDLPEATKKKLDQLIRDHLETTAIDADGKQNIYGLMNLMVRAMVQDGEVIVRMRPRRAQDNLPMPFQLQVLEGDYLDTNINGVQPNGTFAVQGVSFSPFGKIEGYWLFDSHPGGTTFSSGARTTSRMIPVREIAHIYRVDRPGQIRGVSWFAPVILNSKDLADFMDAHLIRQKVAACFAAFVKTSEAYQMDPNAPDATSATAPPFEAFEPGMIEHLRPGEEVTFGSPPQVMDFDPYVKANERRIAAGLGISYEALTGDLSGVNFSSGRMGWLEFQRFIDATRDYTLIPQGCERIGGWFMDAAALLMGTAVKGVRISWTAPKRQMIMPAQEVPAIKVAIRAGLTSRSQEVREMGYDPTELDNEIAEDNARADRLGLVLDSDPRKTSDAGLTQARPKNTVLPPTDVSLADPDAPPPAAPAAPAPPKAGVPAA